MRLLVAWCAAKRQAGRRRVGFTVHSCPRWQTTASVPCVLTLAISACPRPPLELSALLRTAGPLEHAVLQMKVGERERTRLLYERGLVGDLTSPRGRAC